MHLQQVAAKRDLMNPTDPVGAVGEVIRRPVELAVSPGCYREVPRDCDRDLRYRRLRDIYADCIQPEWSPAQPLRVVPVPGKHNVVHQAGTSRERMADRYALIPVSKAGI